MDSEGSARTRPHLVALAVAALLLSSCSAVDPDEGPRADESGSGDPTSVAVPHPTADGPDTAPDLTTAISETREDSVYPEVGDPLVDALHYDLALAWTPEDDHLEAVETLVFRATDDASRFQLDFGGALEISSLSVDGEHADHRQDGKDLVVETAVRADERYTVEITYAGTPESWPAPTDRPDFTDGVGWNVTDDHETWTLQEPYGAFTWYAVNDQPADKALYDFTLTVPEPWTGVANGELTATTEDGGLRTTSWHLAEPASSYLVTVAFGDYTVTELTSESGVPISIWAPTDEPESAGDADFAPEAMTWLEERLGPYPFDTFGILIVDAEFGMETQTMVTLGDTAYSTSPEVVVHELAHHWYGDTVTPNDWRDVWMNEGMATYLQLLWQAESAGSTIEETMESVAAYEAAQRQTAGPPADYDPALFGNGNIYFGPALMWQELRELVGDEAFFDVVREWPASQENQASDREEYWAWIEERTGEELTAFFEDWLLGEETPPTD